MFGEGLFDAKVVSVSGVVIHFRVEGKDAEGAADLGAAEVGGLGFG